MRTPIAILRRPDRLSRLWLVRDPEPRLEETPVDGALASQLTRMARFDVERAAAAARAVRRCDFCRREFASARLLQQHRNDRTKVFFIVTTRTVIMISIFVIMLRSTITFISTLIKTVTTVVGGPPNELGG